YTALLYSSSFALSRLIIFFLLFPPYSLLFSFFFFHSTSPTDISTLSLHDALPISHGCHALLCYNRFQDYIIILYVCHYAYTSSIAAAEAFVRIRVLYFSISYTLMVLGNAVITSGIFLADITTF